MSTNESQLLGQAKQLPETDADYGYVSSIASHSVEEALKEDDSSQPKPVTKTSSFYATVGSAVAGVVALILVNKKLIAAEQSGMATDIISGAITLGMAWVVGKFIEARGKVSVAKVQLTQQQLALKAAQLYDKR